MGYTLLRNQHYSDSTVASQPKYSMGLIARLQQPAGGIQPVSGSKTFPMKANVRKVVHQNNGMNNDNVKKKRYFVWSPPWHLYILLLANLLAFYLKYFLAFYLAYLLAYYLLNFFGILSGKHSGTLSGISSGMLSDILSGILPGISPGTLSGISYGILSGISSRILSDILSGIFSGILSGFWDPTVRTDKNPRLMSSGAHWAGKVPGWGPLVRTELGRSQVEVQQCALSWEGPQLRSSSAHWAWKLAKSLSKSWQGGSAGGSWCGHGRGKTGEGRGEGGGGGGGGEQLLIKSNNPHLAGGEKCDPLLSGVVGISRTGPARSFAAICEPWTPPASL